MTSTVAFPTRTPGTSKGGSNASVVSRQATALEVCDLVYGRTEPLDWAALEHFYDASAVYENPFVTATSRGTIGDIYALSHQLSNVDAPKPLALLRSILGVGRADSAPWFQVVRMWTEIGEVCESESFDGHRRCIVEHTLNILWLPGAHAGFADAATPLPQGHAVAADVGGVLRHGSAAGSGGGPPDPPRPTMPVVGGVLPLPSPLHLELHVLTRLSFNEQGCITHHRDLWDVRDVVRLFPGGALAQWIGTRLAARGLSVASRLGAWVRGEAESGRVRRGEC